MAIQTFFFSTTSDIELVLGDFEKTMNLNFFLAGMSDVETITSYSTLLETLEVGFTSKRSWMKTDMYLALPNANDLNIRPIAQKKGGVKYAVDQYSNKSSIIITLGGVYTLVPNVLIAGKAGTIHNDKDSLNLIKAFSSIVKKHFKKKIDGFFIGPEAFELLEKGWRLTLDEGRSTDYDFKLPNS